MKNKTIIFLIIAILITIIPSIILARNGKIDTNISIGGTSAISSSKEMTNRIVGTMQVVGTIISVITLIIIGIRYMVSSVEEKASLKGILSYWVIGAVLVFATSNILALVYNIINGI